MRRQFTDIPVALACGLTLAAMLLVTAASGCAKDDAQAAPPPPPNVTVAKPVVREVVDFNEYTGRLTAVEEVELRSRVKGYLDSIGFKDGDEVKKGQVLFQIDPRPFDAAVKVAEGQLGQIKARRARAESDVARYKELVPKGAATQQDLDRAIADLGEATAGIGAAEAEVDQAKLDQVYARVAAPIDGMASRAMLRVGNLVGASATGEQLLTTIVRLDPIQIDFSVDQRAAQVYRQASLDSRRARGLGEPKSARELDIPIQFGLASEDGFPHEGVIDFLDNRVNPATGTIAVRAVAKNTERQFRPGYFARVRIASGEPYRAVLVADTAIGTQQGQKYVLVVDDKGTVAFRPVQIGASQNDGLRVVKSGLKGDEQVVVNGIQRARPGSTVKAELAQMPVREAPGGAAPATQPASVAAAAKGRGAGGDKAAGH